MDHKEQHHQKKEKEREHEKAQHNAHEQQDAKKSRLPFHPAWLVVVGFVLTLSAILIWTYIISPKP